jgi:hypothetical protein
MGWVGALGVAEDLAEAREEPRVPPGVQRQRRPGERRWGEGPRHPWTARATCEWCQSTGCRRMATKSHHDLPTGHRHCVRPCDREPPPPPEASNLSRSSRGQRGQSAVSRNPLGVGGGSPRCVVEGRGGSGGCSDGEAKLLEKHIVFGLRKGGKRLHAGEDGRGRGASGAGCGRDRSRRRAAAAIGSRP